MYQDLETQIDQEITQKLEFVGTENLTGHWRNISSNPWNERNRNKLYRDSEPVVKAIARCFYKDVGTRMKLEDLEASCALVFESARKSWNGTIPWPVYFAQCAWYSMCTAYRDDYRNSGRWGYIKSDLDQDETSLNYFRGSYGFAELVDEHLIPDYHSIENQFLAKVTLQELETFVRPEDEKMWVLYKALVTGVHRGTPECPVGRKGEYRREIAYETARRIISRWRGVYVLDMIGGPVYLEDVGR